MGSLAMIFRVLLHLQNLPKEDFNSAKYLSKVVEGIRFPEGKNSRFLFPQQSSNKGIIHDIVELINTTLNMTL